VIPQALDQEPALKATLARFKPPTPSSARPDPSIETTTVKVLITGGAGFVGSHLTDVLLAREIEVICVDDLSKGRLANIAHNLERPGFRFERMDIRDGERLREIGRGIDVVVHLAAAKIPRYESALRVIALNYEGSRSALELARVNNAKLVLASTSDVYGKNPELPFREDSDLVLGPSTSRRWAYAVSKISDEHLALAYQEDFGIPVTALRFFGCYGERQYLNWWGGPQGVFLRAIASDQTVQLHGDGSQTRCFIFVTELVEGCARAIERPVTDGQIINIGTTEEVSIAELAEVMFELSGKSGEPKIELIPYESLAQNYEDPQRRVPDLTRMNALLELTPQIDLREGIGRLWHWYWGLPEGAVELLEVGD
jgi:UDP-glucose 4-epimerase